MSWRDEPATVTQKIALRNALDKRYGVREGREAYGDMDVDHMTKGQASDALGKLYAKKN